MNVVAIRSARAGACVLALGCALGAVHAAHAQDSGQSKYETMQDGKKLLQQGSRAGRATYQRGENGKADTVTVGGQTIELNQLTQGRNVETQEQRGKTLQAQLKADRDNASSNQQAYDDQVKTLEEQGKQAQEDAESDTSMAGEAYRTIRNQKRADIDAMQDDSALWQQTKQVLSQKNPLTSDFTDCKYKTYFYKGSQSESGRLQNDQTCESINPLIEATRTREVNVDSATADLMNTIYPISQDTELSFDLHDYTAGAITQADVTLSWDGLAEDVRVSQEPAPENNWTVKLALTRGTACVAPGNKTCTEGEPNCRCSGALPTTIRLSANLHNLTESLVSDPEGALLSSDQFCTAHWTCDASGPRTIGGLVIDEDSAAQLEPLYPYGANNSPASSQHPLCWKATAKYDCPFNLGAFGCWTTPSGKIRCHANRPGQTQREGDTCAAYKTNSDCHLVRSQCADNAKGDSGHCYVESHVYRCVTPVPINQIQARTTYSCDSSVRCMGNDCVNNPRPEETGSFAAVQARLSVIEHQTDDYGDPDIGYATPVHRSDGTTEVQERQATASRLTSSGQSSNSPATRPNAVSSQGPGQNAPMLPGEAYECRKALGSDLSCCQGLDGKGSNLFMDQYAWNRRQAGAKIARQRYADRGDPKVGGWQTLQQPHNQTAEGLRTPWRTLSESLGDDAGTDAGSPAMSNVMKAYDEEQAEDANKLNAWDCTQEEYTLAAKREAGACEQIGSYCAASNGGACTDLREVYCCFSTSLAKKIRVKIAGGEQAVRDGAFGTAITPQCSAVPAGLVHQEDLTDVDTSDWRARMQLAGQYPTLDTLNQRFNQGRLTGGGSTLATDKAPRKTFKQRTLEHTRNVDTAAIARGIRHDAEARKPAPVATPNGTVINIAPAFDVAYPGQMKVISVIRTGKATGAAQVKYHTQDASARAGTDYVATSGTLQWAAGETGIQSVRVRALSPPGANDENAPPRDFRVVLENANGATLGTTREGIVRLMPGQANSGGTPGGQGLEANIRLVDLKLQRDDHVATYEFTVHNATQHDLSNYVFRVNHPDVGTYISFGMQNGSQWTRLCTTLGNGNNFISDDAAGCVGTGPVAVGETLKFYYITKYSSAVSQATVTCAAQANAVNGQGVYSVLEDQCRDTSSISEDVPPVPPIAGCTAPEGYTRAARGKLSMPDGSAPVITNIATWRDVFGRSPAAGQQSDWPAPQGNSVRLNVAQHQFWSVAFTVGADFPLWGSWNGAPGPQGQWTLDPGADPAHVGWTMSVTSQCGDFFPHEDGPDSTCYAEYTAPGATGLTWAVAKPGGAVPAGACRLERGKSYYLNVVPAALVSDPENQLGHACPQTACAASFRHLGNFAGTPTP
jgi:hypothetical protein